MGIRIGQAGNPGLDPAARPATAGSTIARQVGSSIKPATPQLASVESQEFTQAGAVEMDAAELQSILAEINSYLYEQGSSLSFIHDEASGRSAVQVLDADGNVIRQIPPQELLDVYAKIRNIVSILLDIRG